ncbi:unnamed protein product [Blepharisma stoltei]|uniref:Ubiquitinyl hydrolase 1 n=1 Tax=Blepharisma stoltei TaxID=1481888 RepID=A0AAU9IW19_9CILI|nr:unnamed protein product [Blepharisma stoltei]
MGNSCTGTRKRASSSNILTLSNAGELNSLLDRLGSEQVNLLQEKFRRYQISGGLDFENFQQMMPQINQLPQSAIKSAFYLFDIHGTGKISWKDFCVTMSKSILGRRQDKCEFVFKVFDIENEGELKGKHLASFSRYCEDAIRHFGGSLDNDEFIEKHIQQGKPLQFNEFKDWAIENLELHKLLQPFEIIPSALSEKEIIKKILLESQKAGLRVGDKWNVISLKWFEAWKKYVDFYFGDEKIDESNPQAAFAKFRSKSVMHGMRPIEITNSEIQSEDSELVIDEMHQLGSDYELIPEKAWKELVSWYGGGPEFSREVILENGVPVIEVDLPLLKIHVQNKHGSFSKDPLCLTLSKKKKIKDVISAIMKMKKLEGEFKLYLIKDKAVQLLDPCSTLEESSIAGSCVCRFERETEGEKNNGFDNIIIDEYKEGDHIEFMNEESWNPGYIKEVTEREYIIGGAWLKLSIKILKSETHLLRKPARFPITNEEISGATGLLNIGNTCYLSAVLQCLANTPLLSNFFASESYMEFINTNNPEGSHGKIAKEMGILLREMKSDKYEASTPKKILEEFAKVKTEFQGNDQQDSHECLSMLLQCLHEDLNRRPKSSVGQSSMQITLDDPDVPTERAKSKEQWESLQGSWGSVIFDLCGGQTRRCLICPNCESKRVIFEHFMDLSVPIPLSQDEFQLVVSFIPRSAKDFQKFRFRVSSTDTLETLLERFQSRVRVPLNNLLFAWVQESIIVKIFNPVTVKECLKRRYDLFVYEILSSIQEVENDGIPTLKHKPSKEWRNNLKKGQMVDYMVSDLGWIEGEIVKISSDYIKIEIENDSLKAISSHSNDRNLAPHRKHTTNEDSIFYICLYHMKKYRHSKTFFGVPQILSLGNWYTWKKLKILIISKWQTITKQSDFEDYVYISLLNTKTYDCALCGDEDCYGCPIPDSNEKITWMMENSSKIALCLRWKNPYWNREYVPFEGEDIDSYTIYQCLEEYTKLETLDIECGHCNYPKFTTQMEIWRVPDILIIHLKRFSFLNGQLAKINYKVTFPLQDLDISSWMISSEKTSGNTVSTTRENCLYDLFAVVNHSGNLGSGHYTSYCLANNKTWLFYDDDKVYEVTGDLEEELITPRAYILFYRRRRFASSNVVNLSALI